jgi:hypothetical protein
MTNSMPKVARILSTSSASRLGARRTSGGQQQAIDRPGDREGGGHDEQSPSSGFTAADVNSQSAAKAAAIISSPWARFMMRATPVLERQPHGDQGVHAAQNQAGRECGSEHFSNRKWLRAAATYGDPRSSLRQTYCFHAGFGTTTAAMPGPAGATPV